MEIWDDKEMKTMYMMCAYTHTHTHMLIARKGVTGTGAIKAVSDTRLAGW